MAVLKLQNCHDCCCGQAENTLNDKIVFLRGFTAVCDFPLRYFALFSCCSSRCSDIESHKLWAPLDSLPNNNFRWAARIPPTTTVHPSLSYLCRYGFHRNNRRTSPCRSNYTVLNSNPSIANSLFRKHRAGSPDILHTSRYDFP